MKNKKIAAVLAGAVFAGALNMPCAYAADEKSAKYPSFYEDFESYNIGDTPSYISKDNAFTAKVIGDGENKVLEIKYDRSANYANFNMNLGDTFSKGMYNYSYKAKVVNSNQGDWYFPFMTLQTSSGEIFTSKIAQYGWQLMNAAWMNFDTMKQFVDSNGYYNINRRIDLDNAKHYVQQNTSGAWVEQALSKTAFSTINIRGIYGSGDGFTAAQAKINDEANKDYAVIYIDDIVIEPDTLKITGKNVSATEKLLVSNALELTFNEAVKAVDKSKLTITEKRSVFENNTVKENVKTLSAEEFSVSTSGTKLSIGLSGGWNYGAKYEVTIGEGALTPTSKLEDAYGVISFETESITGGVTGVSDGEIYTADLSTGKYTLNLAVPSNFSGKLYLSKDSGDFSAVEPSAQLDEGEYTLAVVASKGEKTEVKTYKFEVIIAKAPYAEDIKIEGEMYVGNTISGKYTFKDDNAADKEDKAKTEFRWLRKNTETGKYEYITDGEEVYKKQSYTLTEADIDTELKFAVIPVSDHEPNPKTEFESEGYASPARPSAEDVSLKQKEDGTLEISFTYKDINGFAPGEHVYGWYRAADLNEGTARTKIDGADKSTYTLTEDDVDCYIFASVTPKKTKAPTDGAEYFAAEAIAGYFRPTAKNIMLTGKTSAGNVVGVNYVFSDPNDDIEGESEFTWYVGGAVMGHERSLTLTSDMAGKELYCEITPVSTKYPERGAAVRSDTVTVGKKSSSGGGGGGGASVGGGIISTPSTPDDSNKNDAPTPDNTPENNAVFSDIGGHWAKEDIEKAYSMGMINGVDENSFLPDKTVTRAEFAAIIARSLELSSTVGEEYSDVFEDDWFYEAVSAVSGNGYMTGFGGSFRPKSSLTREELAQLAARILPETEQSGAELDFADSADISPWACEAVKKAVAAGIMQGRGNNNFAPNEAVTRAEAVTVMLRILADAEV